MLKCIQHTSLLSTSMSALASQVTFKKYQVMRFLKNILFGIMLDYHIITHEKKKERKIVTFGLLVVILTEFQFVILMYLILLTFKSNVKYSGCKYQFGKIAQLPLVSSVIRQKGKSQNGCFKKTKHAKFSEKTNISYRLTCAYQRIRNVCFSKNLMGFVFLKHPF